MTGSIPDQVHMAFSDLPIIVNPTRIHGDPGTRLCHFSHIIYNNKTRLQYYNIRTMLYV